MDLPTNVGSTTSSTTTPFQIPANLPATNPTPTPTPQPTPSVSLPQTPAPAATAPVQMTRAEYAAKYGQPPATPAAQPPQQNAPVKMTTAEYQQKYQSNPDGTPLNDSQKVTASGVKNPLGKAVVAGGVAAQDTVDALTGNSNTAFDYLNPVGWAAKLFGGATKAVGGAVDALANVTTKPLGSFLGTALRSIVGPEHVDKFVNAPLTQALIKEYSTDPDIAAGLGAVNSFASLAGTITGGAEAIKGLGAISESVAPIARDLQDNAAAGKLSGKNAADVTGRITQTTAPSDLGAAQRSLGTVDMSGVKTYEQGVKVLDDKIKANTDIVDSKFGKSDQKFTQGDLQKEVPVKGGQSPIVSDPVGEGLKQLEDYYTQTNDTSNIARIKGLYDDYVHDGLTPKQINDIAREHGDALNAYNKSGDLAASMKKVEAENTRTGMKDVARSLMPDENTRAVDLNTSDLIKTKEMFQDMSEKVQQLENKVRDSGFLLRAGKAVGHVLDFSSGGFLRGMLRTMQGFSGDGSGMNALELQKALQGNLELLDRLNAMTPPQLEAAFKNPEMLALPSGEGVTPQNPVISLPSSPETPNLGMKAPGGPNTNTVAGQVPLALPAPGSTPQTAMPINLPSSFSGDPYHQPSVINYAKPPQTPVGPPLPPLGFNQ